MVLTLLLYDVLVRVGEGVRVVYPSLKRRRRKLKDVGNHLLGSLPLPSIS